MQDHTPLTIYITCYLGNITVEKDMSNILICCLGNGSYVLHTEAKVLLLSQNGTVGSDWSEILITSARPSSLFWRVRDY